MTINIRSVADLDVGYQRHVGAVIEWRSLAATRPAVLHIIDADETEFGEVGVEIEISDLAMGQVADRASVCVPLSAVLQLADEARAAGEAA
ncbi:hypothetical protein GYA93_19595 [Gordonia desulfuricans]|uniref:Uncharacterized protein n=1 Tax=Gordonia desulfuricans TaxID=89051 RepID=A0A7K3LUB1_9ACTN|nr:hypothetical protein [Gordonia desulfuricans]NDK91759.1 hypothetical protein [Gordonia desulfuricans]